MDLERNIDVGIGSAGARTGAAAVNRAIQSIKRNVKSLTVTSQANSRVMQRTFSQLKTVLIGLAGTLGAASLIGSTKEFGQSIADLSAITGAVGNDLEFLRQKSLEFGAATTLSASESAEAFRIIASAKPDLLENSRALAQVTKEAIALAEATGEDLPTSANTLGAALNQFGEGAGQASRFINVLAAGSKRGAALVAEMSESLKFSGTIASQAGLSFEETNATLQLLSQFAIKGGEAGTQLRMILLSLQTQTESKFNPSIVGISTALDNLAEANLSASEAAKLFGSRNVAAANILINNRQRVAELTEQLTGTNIAYEQQAIRTNTLEGDVKALKSAYEGLELTIGSAGVEGALRGLTQAATAQIRALSKNPLLTAGIQGTLRTTSTMLVDIKLLFKQIGDSITGVTDSAGTWGDIWQRAIQNVINWAKFLWEQFVVGGPANIRLAVTLMVAAFDRLRIRMVEIATVAKLNTEKVFVQLSGAVGRTFDLMKLNILALFDELVNVIQQKLFNAARNLAAIGFEDQARSLTNVGIALGDNFSLYEKALEQARQAKEAREAEVAAINELIAAARLAAETQRQGSRDAVNAAIAERDATIEATKALREKTLAAREAGGSGGSTSSSETTEIDKESPLVKTVEATKKSFEDLNETGKRVFSGIADGISEAATRGKLSFKDMATSIIQDLIRIQLRAQIVNALTGIFGSFFSPAAAPAGGALGAGLPVAARGLDFTVGGVGGQDSQIVAFRATPGESVSVKTPGQQAMAGGGGFSFSQTNHLHAQGADAARIEALLPVWAAQIRREAQKDVILMRDKGVLGR